MTHKTIIPPISIIIAVDETGGFGKDGKIPWNIPEDLAHFKKITSGGICIMGRKTYEDMLSMVKSRTPDKQIDHILPNRTSFVVTRNQNFEPQGATRVSSIREAINSLDEEDTRQIFVIGGLQLFIEALAWTDTIYLSLIKGNFNCDIQFPIDVLNDSYDISHGSKENNITFLTYKRKNKNEIG